jgi:hypothetical protein
MQRLLITPAAYAALRAEARGLRWRAAPRRRGHCLIEVEDFTLAVLAARRRPEETISDCILRCLAERKAN